MNNSERPRLESGKPKKPEGPCILCGKWADLQIKPKTGRPHYVCRECYTKLMNRR